MKLRILCLSSLSVAIPLFLLNSALAGAFPSSDKIELSSQVTNLDAQVPQDLWVAVSLSSVLPPSVAPDTVIVADAADSKDDPHASCANNENATKDQKKLRIRNDESCAADSGILNRLNLPDWATPWKTKKSGVTEEQNDYDSCLGVSTPAGMVLPYHLCCLGIVHAYVNGLADRISKCVFDFARCEMGGWHNDDVCCQSFFIELGSEYATGVNCLPRI